MGAVAGTVRRATHRHTATRLGVYRPRRPRASPLYRLIEDHFEEFATVYDERFSRRWGYWRPVVARVVEKYLACGILKHGFARVRCGSCQHEFLLAFSCKCRYFCPTCHAKRLALWGIWLEQTLLAEVPHRQVVLAVPKRLRPYFLYHRTLLGDLSRVAARTVTAFIRATVGERDLSVGTVSSIQTHGSLANWHPHLHMLVTDGGFRPDGTFVRLPLHWLFLAVADCPLKLDEDDLTVGVWQDEDDVKHVHRSRLDQAVNTPSWVKTATVSTRSGRDLRK